MGYKIGERRLHSSAVRSWTQRYYFTMKDERLSAEAWASAFMIAFFHGGTKKEHNAACAAVYAILN